MQVFLENIENDAKKKMLTIRFVGDVNLQSGGFRDLCKIWLKFECKLDLILAYRLQLTVKNKNDAIHGVSTSQISYKKENAQKEVSSRWQWVPPEHDTASRPCPGSTAVAVSSPSSPPFPLPLRLRRRRNPNRRGWGTSS